MVKFLRILLITVILAAAAGYFVTFLMAARIRDRVRANLMETLVASFSPGKDDQYGFDVGLHLYPLTVEIKDFHIKSKALQVDGDVIKDCDLNIGSIVLDLYPLLKDKKLNVRSVKDRKFSGLLTLDQLAKRLERTGGAMTQIKVEDYNGKGRIRGRFGKVSISVITVEGTWKIDSRKVVTLADRSYYNLDSPVPAGAVAILEQDVSFDIRIHILDQELTGKKVSFNQTGLHITASG